MWECDGTEGEVVISRLSGWGFFLRAMGSYGGVLSREGVASDVGVRNSPLGPNGEPTGCEEMR